MSRYMPCLYSVYYILCIEWFNNSMRVFYITHFSVWNCHCGGQATIFGPKWAILYIYATRELVRPSAITRVISAFCIGTNTDVLQDQPCPRALEQAPLFSFYSSNRKQIIYFQPCLFLCWIFCRLFISSIFTIIVCR